jgi:predicted ribosomally synthesized peptide with nif11-like leader
MTKIRIFFAMSIEAVNQFLTKVSEDQQLQAELAQAMEAENNRQATAELGAKHGYDFTPEELEAEVKNRQSELSEEALEAVAGGGAMEDMMAMSLAMNLAMANAQATSKTSDKGFR